jgi:hypothetical protein
MNEHPTSSPQNAPELCKARGTEDLDLPIDRDFLSLPPRVDLQVMLRRIAENMPFRSTRPGEQERRAEMKVDVEFVL